MTDTRTVWYLEHIQISQAPAGVQVFLKGVYDTHLAVSVIVQRYGNEYRIPLVHCEFTPENKRKFYNSRSHFVTKYRDMKWEHFLPRLLDWNRNPTYVTLFNSWNDTSIQE